MKLVNKRQDGATGQGIGECRDCNCAAMAAAKFKGVAGLGENARYCDMDDGKTDPGLCCKGCESISRCRRRHHCRYCCPWLPD